METTVPQTAGQTSSSLDGLLFYAEIDIKPFSKKNSHTISYRWRGSSTASRRKTPFIRTQTSLSQTFLVSRLRQRARELGIVEPYSVAMHAVFVIFIESFYTKKGRLNKNSGDLDNLIQGPLDALVKSDIIQNDALVTRIVAEKRHGKNCIAISLIRDPNNN